MLTGRTFFNLVRVEMEVAANKWEDFEDQIKEFGFFFWRRRFKSQH